jgi:predicted O-methyltransferase YrrM
MHENVGGTAARVLAIDVPIDAPMDASAVSPVAALAPGGRLIVMESDAARADIARRAAAAAGLAPNVTVIGGDPRRMLYKLAGPFDVIFCNPGYLSARETIERLLAINGVLIANDRR